MKIVEIQTDKDKVGLVFSDEKGETVIQIDVRIMPGDKIIVEAEHLTAPDPSSNGLTFELEDADATAVLQLPE